MLFVFPYGSETIPNELGWKTMVFETPGIVFLMVYDFQDSVMIPVVANNLFPLDKSSGPGWQFPFV